MRVAPPRAWQRYAVASRGASGLTRGFARRTPRSSPEVLVWLCWAVSVVPSTVSLLTAGPGDASGTGQIGGRSIIENVPYRVAMVSLVCILGAAAVMACFERGSSSRRLSQVGTCAFLLVSLCLITQWVSGRGLAYRTVCVLGLIFVCCFQRYSTRVGEAVAWTTITSAGLSLALGAVGVGFDTGWTWGAEKAIIGHSALAGAYSHPNNLGLILCLGLPFVLFRIRKPLNFLLSAMVCLVIALSASRTAIIVASVEIIVSFFLSKRWIRNSLWRVTGVILISVATLLPWVGLPDEIFTGRGAVWRVSAEEVGDSLWGGIGRKALQLGGSISDALGFVPSTSHNTAMTYFVYAGILVWIGVIAFEFILLHNSSPFRASKELGVFVIGFILAGSTEGIVFDQLGSYGGALVPMLFLVTPAVMVGGNVPDQETIGQ